MGVRTEKEYEVHYYEVNYRLDCKMSSIINYFCDIGAIQSNDLGVGIDYLTERRLAWVFYKYDIKVKRYPKFGEKIRASASFLWNLKVGADGAEKRSGLPYQR